MARWCRSSALASLWIEIHRWAAENLVLRMAREALGRRPLLRAKPGVKNRRLWTTCQMGCHPAGLLVVGVPFRLTVGDQGSKAKERQKRYKQGSKGKETRKRYARSEERKRSQARTYNKRKLFEMMASGAEDEDLAVQQQFAAETAKGKHRAEWALVQAKWAEYKRVKAQLG